MRVCTISVRAFATAVFLFALGFAAQPTRAQQTFSYPNFNSTAGLTLNGSAAQFPAPTPGAPAQSPTVLRITPGSTSTVGSTWYSTTLPLQAGFTSTFTFQFTGQGGDGGHADGIAFIVQGSPAGTGYLDTNVGGSVGYGDDDGEGQPTSGISNSVAIEFDTYANPWDPNNNHVSIQSCGTGPNDQHHVNSTCTSGRTGLNPTIFIDSTLGISLTDGNQHTAVVTYSPPSAGVNNLTVTLDGSSVVAVAFDIASLGLDANADAYVGFTGSTGGGYENQDVVSWSFSSQTVTQPVSSTQPTTFAFSNTQGSELTHTVDFTAPGPALVYPVGGAGNVQIQSTNTSVDSTTWPEYVVGGPFAPSLMFPIVENNTNGVGTNGALFVDQCFQPNGSGSAGTPSDANCPFVPSTAPPSTQLLGINVVADLVSKPSITPGTTTALAHYEPSTGSNTMWTPTQGGGTTNAACITTTGASGGTQPAPPTACNTFDVETAISGDQTTSSGRSRSKGTFAMIYNVPMLLSYVSVNNTPVNAPPVNNNGPVSGGLWFSSPLTINFNVSPACNPGPCPWVAGTGTNNFTPAPVAAESFNILAGQPGTTTVLAPVTTANGLTPVSPAPPSATNPVFDTASVRPILFTQGQTLGDGQYTLEWSAVDNVGIQEQNQYLKTMSPPGPCPGTDPTASGPLCYVTSLFSAPLNIDSTPPVATSANAGQTYTAGQKVPASFNCVDPTPGSGVATCVNNGPANLDTTPTNGTSTTKTFTVTATDKAIPANVKTYPFSYVVSCNYAAVTVNPSSISHTKLPTLVGLTASVTDCMTASQKVVVNFSLSGPIGKNCSAGTQSLFSTPPFTIKSGTSSSITLPFPILKGACVGTYNVITTTTVQGSNQPPDVVKSMLTIN